MKIIVRNVIDAFNVTISISIAMCSRSSGNISNITVATAASVQARTTAYFAPIKSF